MKEITLKRVFFAGVTIQVPEIWEVITEEFTEEDGQISHMIGINAPGNDVRSIDIGYGPMPEDSDAYMEACGTYEDVVGEDDIEAADEPIICFQFKDHKAYGFNLCTDDGLPCFFFCIDVLSGGKTNLLTVLACASNDEELQSLIEFIEEYISVQ